MYEIEFGDRTCRYHDEDDLAECRVCHVRPVVKRSSGNGAVRVECPSCGIRTGQSTNENAVMDVWNKVMGGPTIGE